MSVKNPTILVVDDEEAMREVLRRRLCDRGFAVCVAEDGKQAARMAGELELDAVLADVMLPDVSGLDLLRSLRSRNGTVPVIMITAHGTVALAVEAMKAGAHDFLTKPIDYKKLEDLLRDLGTRSTPPEAAPKPREKGSNTFGRLIGASDAMRAVFSMIREISGVDSSILVTGESGTGKELVARTLHDLSPREEGPFVAINTAAIPRELMESEIFGHERGAFTGATNRRQGCFELADGGTLLLDEIAEMPIELQPKLLRVLEDGRLRRLGGKAELHFDTRVLAATNRAPEEAIEKGLLRKDLYYRLNVFSIDLPPLRERTGDLRILLDHFIEVFEKQHGVRTQGVRDEVIEILESYSWPGNVRELRNAAERAVVLAANGWVETRHLPPGIRSPSPESGERIVLTAGTKIADAEKALILKTLEHTGNNKAEAARQLGVDVKTVRNKLKSYGLEEM